MESFAINYLTDVIKARKWDGTQVSEVVKRIEQNIQGDKKDPVALTHLQKTVLNHMDFWGAWDDQEFVGKDLIIQGATSAGKTLLSEIAILDCLSKNKKALVLVPLKALVHERYKQFKRDFAPDGEYNVYASSSDYLDMDQRLINGEYGVGILVYEKLFAMLCQNDCRILQGCGLIVVDELSMLSKDERGPKLEIALEKAKAFAAPPRILCLTTTDNKVDRIKEWLGVTRDAATGEKVAVIPDSARPVGLDEYIVTYDGKYKMRHIPGENESTDRKSAKKTGAEKEPESEPLVTDDPQAQSGVLPGEKESANKENEKEVKFQVPDNREAPSSARRLDLLVEILNSLYKDKPNMKTLVFVPSQYGAASLAETLVKKLSGVLPRVELETSMGTIKDDDAQDSLLEELNHCDPDEDLRTNRDKLLPYGVAYHHSSMSTTLREVIEGFFRKSSYAKVIVATETLTIGVNMPFDTVIITDVMIPRGQGEKHELTNQEYHNYIGRAGRLGMVNQGRSYLLVPGNEQLTKYWNTRDSEQITSALTDSKAETIAPYYLNLLAGQSSFDQKVVAQMYHASLSYICKKKELDTKKIIQLLEQYGMAQEIWAGFGAPQYSLTDIGQILAAYAFDLNTTALLQYAFVNELDEKWAKRRGAGMPADITATAILSDRYLLDILFCICEDTEVKNSHLLQLPSLTGAQAKVPEIRGKIYQALYTLLDDGVLGDHKFERAPEAPPERCWLWNDSAIELFFLSDKLPGWEELQQLYRAIVLFYWTKGKTVGQIKKIIDLSGYRVRCSGGDIERFAEVVSYHLDAVSHLVPFNKGLGLFDGEKISRISRAFYNLSNRVKYGLPVDAVIIANRHVHGLDRSSILKLCYAAHAYGLDTLDYLRAAPIQEIERWITRKQRLDLLRLLQNRYSEGSLEAQLKNVDGDYALNGDVSANLRAISDYSDYYPGELFDALNFVLGNAPGDCLSPCAALNTTTVPCVRKWTYNGPDGIVAVYIAYLYASDANAPTAEQQQSRIQEIKNFFGRAEYRDHTKILISGNTSTQPLYDAANAGVAFTLGLTCENLATLLLSSFWLGSGKTSHSEQAIASRGGADLLFDVLQDTRGIPIHLSLSSTNYTPESNTSKPAYQILMNQDVGEGSVGQQLYGRLLADEKLKQFRLLPWGKALEKGVYVVCPTIILLNPAQIQSSRSLTQFLYRMRQGKFQNCLVLADRQTDVDDWKKPVQKEKAMPWDSANSHCPVQLAESAQKMQEKIQQFVYGWQRQAFLIGISYAHYDGTVPAERNAYESDVAALRKLVGLLNQRYGEQRVLFDENPTCTELGLFYGDHSRAKEAYQQCLLTLVPDNVWTRDNENCKDERAWVKERVQAKKADLWLLQTGSASNPLLDENVYTNHLPTDEAGVQKLADDINTRIEALCKTLDKT